MKDWESVSLPDMWSKLFTPEDFYNWVLQNNIRDTDWSFTTSNVVQEARGRPSV